MDECTMKQYSKLPMKPTDTYWHLDEVGNNFQKYPYSSSPSSATN